MLSLRSLALAAGFAVLGAQSTLAEGTGAKGYVNIINSTPGFVITGFYTNAGHGWTRDWLTNVRLTPGELAVAQFSTAPPKCHQRVRVGWLSTAGREKRGHPISVNICNVSNVYFAQREIFFD